jgi:hypothetical protein
MIGRLEVSAATRLFGFSVINLFKRCLKASFRCQQHHPLFMANEKSVKDMPPGQCYSRRLYLISLELQG